ncbi:MAG: nucleotidyltransferase family protein [Smithellaceae bacterium]
MVRNPDNKDDILNCLLQQKTRLAALGVVSIGLFGSFVRGEQTTLSDIDLLVEFAPDLHTFDNFMELSFLLEDLLGRKVDMVTPEALSPYIGPYILKEVERVAIAA